MRSSGHDMAGYTESFSITALREAYRHGLAPEDVIDAAFARAEANSDNPLWIRLLDHAQVRARAQRLPRDADSVRALPLYGLPFAVKDNIDVAAVGTTAACPEFSYVPSASAAVVQCLEAAGAICIGKTNLDQFATGLVGTRSPYGVCRNAFDPRYVSGGSSAGSALAVALEQVSFALGTDTAGSGRIPAAFNNIVGLKPTRGLVSTRGVVPACRSLDCVSIFALDCADALEVFGVAAAYDPEDPFSCRSRTERCFAQGRLRFAVPRRAQLEFFGDRDYAQLFDASISRLVALGGEPVEVDFEPFAEAQRMLYGGPWLAERVAALREFVSAHASAVHPVVRTVLAKADAMSAVDAFNASYRLAQLRRRVEAVWDEAAVMLLPAAPTIYTIEQVLADPVELNARLGSYTNFVNLLGLCALNVPGGFRRDGLPFGLSLIAPARCDRALAAIAGQMHTALGAPTGALGKRLPGAAPPMPAARTVSIAVVGAHLSGLPLNAQLTCRGAVLVERTQSAPRYRLFALAEGGGVERPGMVRAAAGESGGAIELEVWEMPLEQFGAFVAEVPPPLGIGTVELAGGERVKGFICEHYAVQGKQDITAWGGWRNWLRRGAPVRVSE